MSGAILALDYICTKVNLVWHIKKNPSEDAYQILIYKQGKALDVLIGERNKDILALIKSSIKKIEQAFKL